MVTIIARALQKMVMVAVEIMVTGKALPLMAGWDSGSSCWTLGRGAGVAGIPLWKTAL